MWRASGVIAVLLVLGLAAAGLVSAQKTITGSSSAVVVSDSPAASRSLVTAVASQRTSVGAVSALLKSGVDGVLTHSAETTRVAEATRAGPAPAPSASAPSHLADCGILYLLIHSKSSGDVSGEVGFGVTRQPSPVLTLSSSRCRSADGTKSIKAWLLVGTNASR
jgi:hypothetical protein